MSEERIQIFRGSDAPEITFTESRTAARSKPAAAPADEPQALNDARNGPPDAHALPASASIAEASQQQTIDATLGQQAPELRQLHDSTAQVPMSTEMAPPPAPANVAAAAAADAAQGPAGMRTWQDTSVAAPAGTAMEDSTAVLPAAGSIADSSVMLPAAGAIADSTVMLPPAEAIADSTVMLPPAGAIAGSTVMLPPAGAIADSTVMLPDAAAIHDANVMLPATDVRNDSPGGPAQARQLNDTSMPLPAAGTQSPQDGVVMPAEDSDSRSGPSDTRRLRDTVAAKPGANFQPDAVPIPPAVVAQQDAPEESSGQRQLQDQHADVPAATGNAAASAAAIHAPAVATGGISDPDLTFKAGDAAPWALSIHLQERIASLGVSTARVGHQLDALEDSIKRLGKRIKQ